MSEHAHEFWCFKNCWYETDWNSVSQEEYDKNWHRCTWFGYRKQFFEFIVDNEFANTLFTVDQVAKHHMHRCNAWIYPNNDIFDILVFLEVFKSKGDARKNWKGGELKPGINIFRDVGKGMFSRNIAVFVPHKEN